MDWFLCPKCNHKIRKYRFKKRSKTRQYYMCCQKCLTGIRTNEYGNPTEDN